MGKSLHPPSLDVRVFGVVPEKCEDAGEGLGLTQATFSDGWRRRERREREGRWEGEEGKVRGEDGGRERERRGRQREMGDGR